MQLQRGCSLWHCLPHKIAMNRLRYLPEAETPDTSPQVFLSLDLQ